MVEQAGGGQRLLQLAQSALEDARHSISKFIQRNPERALDEQEQQEQEQLKLWSSLASPWVDEPPVTEVTVPKGTLCHLESTFKVGLPPSMVFKIVTDPGNKRVFKNIQEVKYRKVLEDEGHRRLVEVEQAAIWKFLFWSGTIDIRVLVEEDETSCTLSYKLAKAGFMKKFQGSWVIRPIQHCDNRLASLVHLRQEVQPALVPPPPISWYIRGITTRTTEMMIQDLQAEGQRLRKSVAAADVENAQPVQEVVSTPEHGDAVKLKPKKRSAWKSHKVHSKWDLLK